MKIPVCLAFTLVLALGPQSKADFLLDNYNGDYSSPGGGETVVGDRTVAAGRISGGTITLLAPPSPNTNTEIEYDYSSSPGLGQILGFSIDSISVTNDNSARLKLQVISGGTRHEDVTGFSNGSAFFDFSKVGGIDGDSPFRLILSNASTGSASGRPDITFDNLRAVAVPEPLSLALCGIALVAGGLRMNRRRTSV